MELKVNELARLFGFTTETIRFYERKNILDPDRNSSNNYRSYGPKHLKILTKSRLLRSFGFSLEETLDILTNGSVQDFSEKLKKRENDLILELRNLESICNRIREYSNKISKINENLDVLTIVDSPEFLFLQNQHNFEMLNYQGVIDMSSKLLKLMPFVNLSVLIRMSDFMNENTWSRYHGYSIDPSILFDDEFKKNNSNILSHLELIQSKTCIYTVQSFDLTYESKLKSIKNLHSKLNENNYTVNGDIFGNQLFVDNEMNNIKKKPFAKVYYEYWIPIS